MKKKLKILGIAVLAIIVVYNFLLRPTGIFVVYNNPSSSNTPTIEVGSKALATNLVEPINGDFVCYKALDEYLGKHVRVHRQVAKENDTVKIVNGNLLVNGKNIDAKLNLNHLYKMSKEPYDSIIKLLGSDIKNIEGYFSGPEYLLNLSDDFIRQNNLKLTRLRDSVNHFDKEIYSIYNKKWNKDHFGPLVIPKNKVFVLGDNRDNTYDSRTTGFVDVDDIVGVFFKIF